MEPLVLRHSDGVSTEAFFHPAAENSTRLAVLQVHGIQSHPGWFTRSAEYLAGEGWPVLQVTRRGSGRSPDPWRGDAPSAGRLLDDLDEAVRRLQELTGVDRVHLVGISWGGKWLAAWLAGGRGRQTGASLTMIAPGLAPRVDVRLGKKLAIAACLVVRSRTRFEIPLSDVDLFTDNPARRQWLREDEHRLHRATARFLYASRKLDGLIARAPRGAINLPTSLMLASRDRIIDNERTREIVDRLTAEQADVHVLEGAHTLEFEPDPSPLLELLAGSLQSAEADGATESPE